MGALLLEWKSGDAHKHSVKLSPHQLFLCLCCPAFILTTYLDYNVVCSYFGNNQSVPLQRSIFFPVLEEQKAIIQSYVR